MTDLRLLRIKTVGSQAIELSVDAFNFLNVLGDGIDAFNQGFVNNLYKSNWNTDRNWGGTSIWVTPTAFNATTEQYTYRVNANAGKTQRQGTLYQIRKPVTRLKPLVSPFSANTRPIWPGVRRYLVFFTSSIHYWANVHTKK